MGKFSRQIRQGFQANSAGKSIEKSAEKSTRKDPPQNPPWKKQAPSECDGFTDFSFCSSFLSDGKRRRTPNAKECCFAMHSSLELLCCALQVDGKVDREGSTNQYLLALAWWHASQPLQELEAFGGCDCRVRPAHQEAAVNPRAGRICEEISWGSCRENLAGPLSLQGYQPLHLVCRRLQAKSAEK